SLKWTRKQLHVGKGIFNKCRVNPWNAFVRQELNKYNEGRGVGDRLKLPVFITENRTQLMTSYCRLTVADKNHLQDNVETLRQSRVKVTRANPKALQKDVNATFNAMQTEVLNFYSVHEIRTKWLNSGLLSRLEQVLRGSTLLSVAMSSSTTSRSSFIHLRLLHSSKTVTMNYDNYEQKIVETYAVALQG
ncbi:uncharacterized protein EDB91DRAFT_1040140, partial [Suillus paluster]|uniref:uncharacterized protein n=1 Tax=Suillus paluster TaxID=48578 RepID=UPI001B8676B2